MSDSQLIARLREVSDAAALLGGIVEHSPVALQIYRADGVCLLCSPAFRELVGEPPPDLLEAVRRAFAGESVARFPQCTVVPLRDREGAVEHVAVVFRNLEDERRLRLQATVLRNIRDSVIVTDLEGRILEWNRGATEVFGYRADEMIGRTPAILYPDLDPIALAADLARIAEGRDHAGEWLGRRKDGTQLWIDVKTTLVRDESGRPIGFVGIGKDVTDRRRAEDARAEADRERERALALAESASRAKDEFLAMLGHELRNPLAPIVTALDLMRLRSGSPTSREQQVIERQVEHLVRLVDDLLDVSRITRGKVELDCRAIELHAAVVKAAEMAGPLFEQRHHRLEVDVPEEGLRLHADAARLVQIIANLLTNAARYTPPGGLVRLSARRDGDFAALSVADDGIGIEPSLLPRVFDLFVQGERSLERAEGGLGLGLTLVQNLVRLHGGTVEARSPGAGCGSEFVVRLPTIPDRGAELAASLPPAVPATPTPRRIIVVDDNVDAADLTAVLLERAGHQVHVAHDGPGALNLAARVRPEIALLDIGLPVMNGYELADRLRASFGPAAPRLIAITGYGQGSDRERSLAAGFDDHLVKPVAPDLLLSRIDALR
ncbi:MAG TPA: PAS domain S-box protein [Kofleriaceae bacterium]|nr:PAS domain S-box protein [Kofleriaceae bacterium]